MLPQISKKKKKSSIKCLPAYRRLIFKIRDLTFIFGEILIFRKNTRYICNAKMQ